MIFDYRNEYTRYKRYYTYLEPMTRNPVARAYFSLVLSFLVMTFFGILAIRPTVRTIVSLKKEINDKKNINNLLQEKINALSLAQGDFSIISNDLPLVYSAMPKDPRIAILVEKIENAAKGSGAELNSIQVQSIPLIEASDAAKQTMTKEAKRGIEALVGSFMQPGEKVYVPPALSKPRAISLSVSLTGPYPSFLYFIESLAYFERLLVIDRTTVSVQRDDKTSTESLTLNVSAIAYFLKED
jgi:Tfp pilus assembly protein PilO